MDDADRAQLVEIPMFRGIATERCRCCGMVFAPHLLEKGMCIDCDCDKEDDNQ